MKRMLTIGLVLLATACTEPEDAGPSPDEIQGFWRREVVYLNGVNSAEYAIGLNGTGSLFFNADGTFRGVYESGTWKLENHDLVLYRHPDSGLTSWRYDIVGYSGDVLTLETKLTEQEYRWNFDAFGDNEEITIREVYRRQ